MNTPSQSKRRPLRSHLYLPANSDRKIEKAFESQADAIVLDLEDALAISEKPAARAKLTNLLSHPLPRPAYVRVNAMTTSHCFKDISAIISPHLSGIVLPKVEAAHELQTIDWLVAQLEEEHGLAPRSIEIVPIVETAKGIAAVNDIAGAASRVRHMAFGMVDLAADMQLDLGDDHGAIAHARFAVAVASRAAGLEGPLDTAFVEIKNLERLRRTASQARAMGYIGKGCIHPDQIPVVNEVFSPTPAEIARAKRIIDAFAAAEASGAAAISVDGLMIDYPVVTWAQHVMSFQASLDSQASG